jgi:CheY-like chemotaxis protein
VIASLNCRVTLLRDGDELVEEYRCHYDTIDYILTDLDMPRKNGFDAIVAIRRFERQRRLLETPIIILTGNGSKRNQDTAKRIGANDFLIKPIDR